MFIQVITGKVNDAEGLRRQGDRWEVELRPGAKGFLGTTSGITTDGRFIAIARFESAEAARANSERAEQGEWWAEMEKNLTDVAFADSVDVKLILGGGSDEAGFVQVMRGRVTDPAKMAAFEARTGELEAAMRSFRPDILGETIAVHGDGTYTDAVYFRSEAEARAAEQLTPPADVQALLGDLEAAIEVTDYLDVTDPWLR